jgi:uncharacterized protein
MNELVLLTGASSGIGYSMAKELATKRLDMILVARSLDKLAALKTELEQQFGVRVYVIDKDLSKTENAVALYDEVKKMGLTVTMLINNAGYGGYGDFADTSLEAELNMIELNISSVVILTKLFLADMKRVNHGRIMNVASLLSFLPFPYYSVYSATKAFVLSFSETLRAELENTGITVTVLCPGPVDTAFNTDKMLTTNAYAANKPIDPKVVAKAGIRAMMAGSGTEIVGLNNWFLANTPRFSPRWLTMKINKFLAGQKAQTAA